MSYTEQAIQLAIEGGWKPSPKAQGAVSQIAKTKEEIINALAVLYIDLCLLDPLYWKALGKSLGWGQEIDKTKTGKEHGERFCLHCGVSTSYQPPRESGCNHAHYPEACKVCSGKAITYLERWTSLIKHIDGGESAETFFKGLLDKRKEDEKRTTKERVL